MEKEQDILFSWLLLGLLLHWNMVWIYNVIFFSSDIRQIY